MQWKEKSVKVTIERKIGWFVNPNELPSNTQEMLVSALYPVAKSAFGQMDSQGFYQDVKDHILNTNNLLIIGDTVGKPIAFRMWKFIYHKDYIILYLAGMCVDSEWQGKGLGRAMLKFVINYTETVNVCWTHAALRTQNPIMQRCFDGISKKSGMYKFGDIEIPIEIQEVARIVATSIGDMKLEPEKLVSREVYGSSLYGEKTKIVEKSQGTNFANLNQEVGDAAYCILSK
jgi:GNAT superfamily N-acetyltransferase